MPLLRRKKITEVLRYRIERGLSTKALRGGDRLPSTRELARELKANPRVILAAYRELSAEGLVEIRKRSGNFVGARNLISDVRSAPPTSLVVNTLADGIERGYSTREFSNYLADASFGPGVRAAIVAGTIDQAEGISRELRTQFSVGTSTLAPEAVKLRGDIPAVLRRADFIVTTEAYGDRMGRLAARVLKPLVVITVRDNIINDEWHALMSRGVSVIACDRKFLDLMRHYLSSSPHAGAVKMFEAGVDSLDSIQGEDVTYITEAARKKLGTTRLPGTLVLPPRFISPACVLAILNIIVSLRFDRKPPAAQ